MHAVEALALHIEAMLADGDATPEPSALGGMPEWLAEDAGTVLGYCLVPVDVPT